MRVQRHVEIGVVGSWFLVAPSSHCCLFPPPLLVRFLLFPPLFSYSSCHEGILTRSNSAQHGSSGDMNHHQQQLHEVDKNYRMLFSKGVTEIEYVTTIPKDWDLINTWREWSHSSGLYQQSKSSQYLGAINSSVFTEKTGFFSICQMEKWNSSISKGGRY